MRVSALILLSIVTLFFIGLAQFAKKERRVPFSVLVYLLVTGFIYMLIQVAFMAKLELFLQDALVSMASVITIFLLMNGVGSWTYKQVAGRLGMIFFPILTGVVVLLCTLALNYLVPKMMDLNLMGRLAITALTIAPVGWLLGMFYPYSVDALLRHEKGEAVPLTYGISTLSSVIGASYATIFMIVLGFNEMLFQGVALYFVLAGFVIIWKFTSKVNYFS
jgi:predicted membrane-bound spermidine synthase